MSATIRSRLERQARTWRRENHDRPTLGFTGGYFASDALRMLDRSEGQPAPGDVNIARVLEDSDASAAAWAGCMGDLFWTAGPMLGFPWLPAIIGAPVSVRGGAVWAEACIKDYQQVDGFIVALDDPNNEWMLKLWDLLDALVAHAAGRYPVATDQFMAPLTTLAEIRGSTQLAFDVYDHPDGLSRALDVLTQAYCQLVVTSYERIPPWHRGYVSLQRQIWAPDRVIEFNEDPSFIFSPKQYARFVLSSHRQVVRVLPYAYIHVHSTQIHTLDYLLDIDDLPAIEYTPDYGSVVADLIPTMQKIQARKPIIVHAFLTADEMRMIIDRVPPEGMFLIARVEGPDAARQLQDEVMSQL